MTKDSIGDNLLKYLSIYFILKISIVDNNFLNLNDYLIENLSLKEPEMHRDFLIQELTQ